MTGYRDSRLDAALLDYFATREAARTDRIRSFLNNLTDRERALIGDIAVMGYVRGTMHPKGERTPKRQEVLAEVVDACFAYPDLYPVVATLERCPRFPEGCPNLRVTPADPPRPAGVRCGCADDPEGDAE